MADSHSLEEMINNILNERVEQLVKKIIIENIPMIINDINDHTINNSTCNLLSNLDFEFIDTSDIDVLDDENLEEMINDPILNDQVDKILVEDICKIDCLDLIYAKKNYQNAYNYIDLISPDLNSEEISFIKLNGPINGCYEIIKRRCIDNKTKNTIPFHCISYKKDKNGVEILDFILKNYDWIIDLKGEQILKEIYPKIKSIYDVGNARNLTAKMRNLKSITNLEKNRHKILKRINRDLIKLDKMEKNNNKLKISTKDCKI